MLPVPPPTPPRSVALSRAQARLVWSVLAVMLVAAVVGASIGAATVPMPGDPQIGTLLLIVACVMVPVDLAASCLVTSRMRRRPAAGVLPESLAGTQMIVGSAVALGAGLMCCVFFFVSREPLLLALVIPCAAVLLHWFPSQGRWAALASPPAPGEPRRNPMVRE